MGGGGSEGDTGIRITRETTGFIQRKLSNCMVGYLANKYDPGVWGPRNSVR